MPESVSRSREVAATNSAASRYRLDNPEGAEYGCAVPRRLLAAVVVAVSAAAFVAVASAGLSGKGSLARSSGFTLYAYVYSVQFNHPVSVFEIDFMPGFKVTSVTNPVTAAPGHCMIAKYTFQCLVNAAANEVLAGTVYS